MKKKALAFAAAACALGMLLSGCGASNDAASDGGNIITAYNSEPQNPLIPGNTNETGGGKPIDLLFSRLISFDAKGNASNEVAESIEANADATQYTIKLKKGWKFTDGTPVTAESFTKAWSYTANAKNAQKCASFFSTIKGYDKLQDADNLKGDEQLEGLTVVNDNEFTVEAYNKAGSVIQQFTIPSGLKHFEAGTEEGTLRRQAISMAINRNNICEKVLNGTGTPASDFTSPLTPGYSDSLKGSDNLKYNASKAKELWEKANAISPWTSDDKLTFAYNADGGHETIYTAVVNSINNTLGSEVAATNPYPTFNDYRTAVSDRKVQGAFRSGWQPDYPSAENYLVQNFSSSAADGNGSNDGDYKNSKFDDLCNQAAAAQTTDEANKLYQQAQEVLLNDLPAVPLYYANAYGVASTNVSNFEMNWQNLPVYENMTKSK